MGLGIAKVDKHAVAQILRHETAETAHGFSDVCVIGRDELSQVFRIHSGGECSPTNEVREHHRDLATLGMVLASYALGYRCINTRRLCARIGAQRGDGVEKLEAMPKCRDAKLF